MKYLEDEKLSNLTSTLTDAVLSGSTTNRRVINGRIEAYTMKRGTTDKKYAYALGERFLHEMESDKLDVAKLRDSSNGAPRTSSRSSSAGSQGSAVGRRGGGRRRCQSVGSEVEGKSGGGVLKNSSSSRRRRSSSFDHIYPLHRGKSPPHTGYFAKSSLGDFHEMGTRRLMTDLILTLNASYPDYDFSNARPSHFSRLPSASTAMNRVNERLSAFAAATSTGFLPKLWAAIDDVIVLAETEVYSYVPPQRDGDDDPYGFLTQTLAESEFDGREEGGSSAISTTESDGGNPAVVPLWTFNYFFVNKSLKRIVFFACVQTMRNESAAYLMADEDDEFVERATNEIPEESELRQQSDGSPNASTRGSRVVYPKPTASPGVYASSIHSGYFSADTEKSEGGECDVFGEFDMDEDGTGPGTLRGTVSPPTPPRTPVVDGHWE